VPDHVVTATGTYRVVADPLGSPRRVVNVADDADVLLDVGYDEFGNASGAGLADGTFVFRKGDAESRWYLY